MERSGAGVNMQSDVNIVNCKCNEAAVAVVNSARIRDSLLSAENTVAAQNYLWLFCL